MRQFLASAFIVFTSSIALLSPARAAEDTSALSFAVTISLHGHSVYAGVAKVALGEMTSLDHRSPFPLSTTCTVPGSSGSHATLTSGQQGQTIEIGAMSFKDGLVTTLVNLSDTRLVKKLKLVSGACIGEIPVLQKWVASTSLQVSLSQAQTVHVGGYTVTVQLLAGKLAVPTNSREPLLDSITI